MGQFIDSDVIGTGGFGEVCKCTSGKRVYAKKKLTQYTDPGAVDRFKREVKILSQLDHPNIVKVVDQKLGSPPYWYVMPFYASSLEDVLSSGYLQDNRIEKLFKAILDGVEHAHNEGVIHRDLKPANILINNDDDLVVSDFGLGRMLDADSTRQTMSGFGMGSLFFMAPEQTNNAKNADFRSDVFALGRILYCLHTGPATSLYADLSQLKPNIRAIVTKATQITPERRFQTVNEFKNAWQISIGSISKESPSQQIEELVNGFTTGVSSITPEGAAKVAELILEYVDDADFLHSVFMKIPNEVVVLAIQSRFGEMRQIVHAFANATAASSYTFSYTDKIGDKCKSLYNLVEDFDIRADLAYCLFEVGYGHNRYYVMDQFDAILESIDEPGQSLVIIERLKSCSTYHLAEAKKRLSKGKLDGKLREFFNSH